MSPEDGHPDSSLSEDLHHLSLTENSLAFASPNMVNSSPDHRHSSRDLAVAQPDNGVGASDGDTRPSASGANYGSPGQPINPHVQNQNRHNEPIISGSGVDTEAVDDEEDWDSERDLLEAEYEFDDFDSAMGDDDSIYAATLDGSIKEHIWENGRRYHSYRAGTYLFPNDETELNREDMKDHMTRLMLDGRLTFAELEKEPLNALDLGTGTGKWAMEFAEENAGCRVLAVDLSPVQPNFTPPNLEFQVDDIEADWTYKEDSFDYIHIRYMAVAVRDWQQLLERCYSTLRPGGTIEIIDMDLNYTSDDGTVLPENRLLVFMNQLTSASTIRGVNMKIVPEMPSKLQEIGYGNIRFQCPKLPIGWWPKDPRTKEIGLYQYTQFLDALQGIAMGAFIKILGWTTNQVEAMLVGVREDCKNQKIHGYWRNYFVSAQKL